MLISTGKSKYDQIVHQCRSVDWNSYNYC